MNTKYRPFFIIFSILFLGVSVYFIYAIHSGSISKDLGYRKIAEQIKNIPVKISTIVAGEDIQSGDSKRMFQFEGKSCPLNWSVYIHSEKSNPNLTLHFENVSPMSCDKNKETQIQYHQSMMKKIFHDFDRKRFYEISLSDSSVWKLDREDSPLKILKSILEPFGMNVLSQTNTNSYSLEAK